jgi:hypothetical protein
VGLARRKATRLKLQGRKGQEARDLRVACKKNMDLKRASL